MSHHWVWRLAWAAPAVVAIPVILPFAVYSILHLLGVKGGRK